MTQNRLDAHSGVDGGRKLDSIAIQVSCEKLPPSEVGNFSKSVIQQVQTIMLGQGCNTVMLDSKIDSHCENRKDGEKPSSLRFDPKHVEVFILKNQEGYSLQEGKMLYDAFVGVCGNYPATSVKALGIELVPKGESHTKMSAEIEHTGDGDVARIYVWGGEVQMGDLTLQEGQQAVVRKDTNGELVVISKHGFDTTAEPLSTDMGDYARGAQVSIDTGCSTSPDAGVNVDPVSMITVGSAALLAIAARRIKESTAAVFTRNSSQ